jgi:hypothetical protein
VRPLVRGCVFDSCPCYMHKYAGANALAHGFPPPLRPLVRGLFHLLVLLSFALQGDYPQQFWCVGCPALPPQTCRWHACWRACRPCAARAFVAGGRALSRAEARLARTAGAPRWSLTWARPSSTSTRLTIRCATRSSWRS